MYGVARLEMEDHRPLFTNSMRDPSSARDAKLKEGSHQDRDDFSFFLPTSSFNKRPFEF